jgi:hypothetical protein
MHCHYYVHLGKNQQYFTNKKYFRKRAAIFDVRCASREQGVGIIDEINSILSHLMRRPSVV